MALTYLRTECYDLGGGISDHLDTIFMVRHGAGQICNLKIYLLNKDKKLIIITKKNLHTSTSLLAWSVKISPNSSTSFSWPSLAAAKSINNGVSGSRKLSDT